MNAPFLYHVAAVLLILFAAGHTLGFLRFKAPTAEGVAVRDAMAKVTFTVGRKSFSYERFYVGFGLYITVFLLFSSFLAWHLASLAAGSPKAIGSLGWAFFGVQIASLALSWRYFFPITAVFSGLVSLCVGWAAWLMA